MHQNVQAFGDSLLQALQVLVSVECRHVCSALDSSLQALQGLLQALHVLVGQRHICVVWKRLSHSYCAKKISKPIE